jgi:hypothetical protein
MTERITAAAIRLADGRVFKAPPPARHPDVLRAMHAHGIEHESHDQGFWTSRHRYVDRTEAMVIATTAGQVRRRNLPGDYDGPELFSEDLW